MLASICLLVFRDSWLQLHCESASVTKAGMHRSYLALMCMRNFFAPFQIGDSDAGWTLGYMLNMTNMIPAEAPDTPPLPHAGYVTVMVLLALLLPSLVFLGYRSFRRSGSASRKQIV